MMLFRDPMLQTHTHRRGLSKMSQVIVLATTQTQLDEP